MKIEIEISDQYARILSQWASVSRTLRTAERGCAHASDSGAPESDAEMYQNCANELNELIPALNELHRIARQAMWDIKHRAEAVAQLEKTTITQRREAIAIMKTAPNPLYFDFINAICDELGVSRTLRSEFVIDWLKGVQDA